MKVYDKRKEFQYDYPEDMKKILEYLHANGDLHISGETVEHMYVVFSLGHYHEEWANVTENVLENFADWLDNYEL